MSKRNEYMEKNRTETGNEHDIFTEEINTPYVKEKTKKKLYKKRDYNKPSKNENKDLETKSSTESVIYMGTFYKFAGYTISDTIPPVIDLTQNSSNISIKSKKSVVFNHDGSVLYSMPHLCGMIDLGRKRKLPHHPQTTPVSQNTCSRAFDAAKFKKYKRSRSYPNVLNIKHRAAENSINRSPKRFISYAELNCGDGLSVDVDKQMIDNVLDLEEDYETDDALRTFNIFEKSEATEENDLKSVDKSDLVENMNLSLNQLTNVYL